MTVISTSCRISEQQAQLTSEQQQLAADHMHVVNKVVFQVSSSFPRYVEREDLIRAGSLGLVEAARRFDSSRGVPFAQFAMQRIRGAIMDSVRAIDWAPRSVRAQSRTLRHVESELMAELGRTPKKEETASFLGIDVADVEKIQARAYHSTVLAFDGIYEREGSGESDISVSLSDDEPAEALEKRELLSFLRDAVSLLPERHRLIIIGYFLENKTSTELATFIGVTESRVSQMRSEALDMLRSGIGGQFTDKVENLDVDTSTKSKRQTKRTNEYVSAIAQRTGIFDRLQDVCGGSSLHAPV